MTREPLGTGVPPLSLPQVVWRFRVAIFVYWAMSVAFVGFWLLYFEEVKQISQQNMGWMMSLYTTAALVGQYVFGYVSDKLQGIRLPVMVGSAGLAVIAASFPWQSSLPGLYASMAGIGFLQQPLGPLLDSWAMKHLRLHGQVQLYGQIRGFGSLGWASCALLTAYLITWTHWNVMFVVTAGMGITLCLWVLGIPDVKLAADSTSARPRLTLAMASGYLLRNSAYVYVLLVVFVLYLGAQTAYNFLGLVIKDSGGGVTELGWTFFISAGSEIPAMFLSVYWLSRWVPRRLMLVAVGLYLVRFALIIVFQQPLVITFSAMLEGVAFALMLTALRKYIFEVVAEEVQTSALTMADAVFLSLSVIVGGAAGGWISQHYGVMSLMIACMAASFVACILLLLGKRFDRGGPASRAVVLEPPRVEV